MAGNPVGWFEIYVQDMERAKRFYEAVFQVELNSLASGSPEMWAFQGSMTSYGAPGALVRMDGVPSGGNSTLVYFSCEDCAVEAERVAGSGGKVFKAKTAIGEYGFIALAFDTENNLIGLHSLK